MGYILISDLFGENRFFANFAEHLYGTNSALGTAGSVVLQADIDFWSNWMDDRMRTVDRFSLLPVRKGTNGEYPNAVRSWCAYSVIYHKLVSRFQAEFETLPDSIEHYGTWAEREGSTVLTGGAIFDNEIDAGELGIGQSQVVGTLGADTRGTFHTNWRGYPFGDSVRYLSAANLEGFFPSRYALQGYPSEGFLGADFPRTWIVEITTAGGVGTAEFKWSMDGGIVWEEEEVTTDYDFDHLMDNVWVRFEGDAIGSHHFTDGDKWRFQTVPEDIRRSYGSTEARIGRAGRGF